MPAPDQEGLRSRAAAGDLRAAGELGARLFAGKDGPPAPYEGLELLVKAAQGGVAEASCVVATAAALGVGTSQNWPAALSYLHRAAANGGAEAGRQLELLAGSAAGSAPTDEAPADRWRRLRTAIDIPSLTAIPPTHLLSDSPDVRVAEAFIDPAVCDWIIGRARPRIAPAKVYDPKTGAAAEARGRSNGAMEFDLLTLDMVVAVTRMRLAALSGVAPEALESTQVLHYAVGQQFGPHFDFIEATAPGHAAELAARGQRIMTALIYLNDGFEGGETAFLHAGLKFKGRKGDVLLFRNVGADGEPDRRTLHAGLAPTSGEKWLLSQWIRRR